MRKQESVFYHGVHSLSCVSFSSLKCRVEPKVNHLAAGEPGNRAAANVARVEEQEEALPMIRIKFLADDHAIS